MKGYEQYKANGNIKFETVAEGIRVMCGSYNQMTGEQNFAEVVVTNTKHQTDVLDNLQIELAKENERHAAVVADIKARIDGHKALRADVREIEKNLNSGKPKPNKKVKGKK